MCTANLSLTPTLKRIRAVSISAKAAIRFSPFLSDESSETSASAVRRAPTAELVGLGGGSQNSRQPTVGPFLGDKCFDGLFWLVCLGVGDQCLVTGVTANYSS